MASLYKIASFVNSLAQFMAADRQDYMAKMAACGGKKKSKKRLAKRAGLDKYAEFREQLAQYIGMIKEARGAGSAGGGHGGGSWMRDRRPRTSSSIKGNPFRSLMNWTNRNKIKMENELAQQSAVSPADFAVEQAAAQKAANPPAYVPGTNTGNSVSQVEINGAPTDNLATNYDAANYVAQAGSESKEQTPEEKRNAYKKVQELYANNYMPDPHGLANNFIEEPSGLRRRPTDRRPFLSGPTYLVPTIDKNQAKTMANPNAPIPKTMDRTSRQNMHDAIAQQQKSAPRKGFFRGLKEQAMENVQNRYGR